MLLTVFKMSIEVAAFVVPAFTALFIYFASVMSEHRRRKQHIINARLVVFSWSEMIRGVVIKQIDSLEELSSEIKSSDDPNPKPYYFMRNMADKLGDVSAEKMTSLFIANSRLMRPKRGKQSRANREKELREAVFNLVSQFDYLEAFESEVRKNYDNYNHECLNLTESWNLLMKKTQADLEKMSSSVSDSSDKYIFNSLDKVIRNYFSKRAGLPFSFDLTYKELIAPLNQAVDDCKTKYPNSIKGLELYADARNMMLLYNQWETNINGFSEVFKSISNTLNVVMNTLDKALLFLKNETVVKCFV